MRAGEDLRQRLETLAAEAPYQRYHDVRRRVLTLQDAAYGGDGAGRPSVYWREELSGFEYMLDASPLIIDKLRHHCYHVTGLRAYDYRSGRDNLHQRLHGKLDRLLEIGGEDLFVPEPRLLGGFGFPYGDGLFNIDTLKFYEATIALQRGAVLSHLRQNRDRPVVWEIGAGWGGMAYTLKTLCPNVTYVITDLPELFLFSAVYLQSAFPQARIGFYGDAPLEELMRMDLDFLFTPHTALEELALPRLDLTVNMVSFQEMTSDQVEGYVERSYELGSRYLYSLNRDRSHYNRELRSVSDIVERRYWPHEIPVLDMDYTQTSEPKKKVGRAVGQLKALAAKILRAGSRLKAKATNDADKDLRMNYRHVIGWRRLDG
jgi:hypothetical protein